MRAPTCRFQWLGFINSWYEGIYIGGSKLVALNINHGKSPFSNQEIHPIMHGPFFFPRFPLPYQARMSPRSLHRLDPENLKKFLRWHESFKKITTRPARPNKSTPKLHQEKQFPGYIHHFYANIFFDEICVLLFSLQVAVLMAATSSMLQRYQCHVKLVTRW